jgi:predicted acylesterase/phospholipase RssA
VVIRIIGVGVLSALLGGCTVPRLPAPPSFYGTGIPAGFPPSIRQLSRDLRAVDAQMPTLLDNLRHAAPDGVLQVLAISGGGAAGAFGAGALVGLTERGERPRFQLVTGVSTGALLAPFAFLGPAWDRQLTAAFSGESTIGLLQSRGLAALFRPGLYQSAPLVAVVDRFVTPELVNAVAKEARGGRMLLIATTDLDKQEAVIWDLGLVAEQGGERARRLFRDLLVASATIPGVFPPVLIHVQDRAGHRYDEMHVDGGTSTPFFIAPEAVFAARVDPRQLTGAKVYVLINGQLVGPPSTTPDRTLPILGRSLSAVSRYSSRSALEAVDEFAKRTGMSLHFTSIPGSYPEVGVLDFRRDSMQSLYQLGERCAVRGQLWTTLEQAAAQGERDAVEGNGPMTSGAGREGECPVEDSALPTSGLR